ncbi:Rha family transcriptional regulator [Jeotgalibacillus marinus]|uniref:Rha family transcriptional regulator n=1 Tax=Jeotgalibacillus marinus TaxID=86667 RepID=A0ABV3Q300_9BACL
MEELVFFNGEKILTDSLTVSKAFDMEHEEVLKDIDRKIHKLSELGEDEFSRFNFNKTGTKYNLTEDGLILFTLSYDMNVKNRFIEAFKRIRNKLPSNFKESGNKLFD